MSHTRKNVIQVWNNMRVNNDNRIFFLSELSLYHFSQNGSVLCIHEIYNVFFYFNTAQTPNVACEFGPLILSDTSAVDRVFLCTSSP